VYTKICTFQEFFLTLTHNQNVTLEAINQQLKVALIMLDALDRKVGFTGIEQDNLDLALLLYQFNTVHKDTFP